jgi:hypothetical protein
MHDRQTNQTANHRSVVDLIDVVQRAKIASIDLARRGGALVV